MVGHEGQPLTEATLHSSDYLLYINSDSNGVLTIPIKKLRDTLYLTSLGYETMIIGRNEITSSPESIVLMPLYQNVETVVIIGRTGTPQQELSYQIDKIDARDISFTNSQTSADVLAAHADVFVQKSQMGGGSPVIRGFEANRVLLVLDGVRMNNAIYRSGHLQNAITVDPAILEQMEVIYGPGSLLYGSDALGGVVHFRTKDPRLSLGGKNASSAYGSLRYASANKEKSGHLHFNVGGRKLASLTSFSFSDFGDLSTGRRYNDKYPDYGKRLYYVDTEGAEDRIVRNPDPHKQVGTGYHQYDFLQKWKWQPNLTFSQVLNVQYSTSSDIPRYDQLTETGDGPQDLRFAEWHYGPQKRLFIGSQSQWLNPDGSWFDKALLIGAVQRIDEDRVDRRFQSDSRTHQEENLWVYSITADFEKDLEGLDGQLSYGIEGDWNDLNSVAFEENRSGTERSPALTRYPDDAATLDAYGAYANLRVKFSDSWSGNVGARLSRISSYIRYQNNDLIQWPSSFTNGIRSTSNSFTWGLNLNYQPTERWVVHSHVGTAFRAPNIDDLAKIRVKGGTASAPNPNLQPERALHTEITLSHQAAANRPGTYFSITGFATRLEDAVIQAPFQLPEGDTLFYHDEEWFRVVANVNAEEGLMYGLSVNGGYDLSRQFLLSGSINYIRGDAKTIEGNEEPMAHVPPLYGKASLQYQNQDLRTELVWRFNGSKPLDRYSSNSADNIEKATPEGTLAWSTFNVYLRYQITQTISLQAAVENIADLHYRPFASGVSAPGRNFILSVAADLSK